MGRLHEALRKAEEERSRAAGARAPQRPAQAAPAPASAAPHGGASAVAVAPAPAKASGQSSAAPAASAAEPRPAAAPETPAAQTILPGAALADVDPHLVVVTEPRSPLAEQYRALRTNLLALGAAQGWKAFVVTSSVPGEGKSVSSANLACALAEQADRKVVLVDADLRKPTQHRLFSLDNQRGLADYLAGGTMLEMALQRSRLQNLWVLPAGRSPASPAELLSGKRMDDLLARLRRDYDAVILDTPPVVSTTDAAVLSPKADGTVLVVRMEETQREVTKHALDLLRKARANVVGTVLTGLQGAVKDYYYYPYHGDAARS